MSYKLEQHRDNLVQNNKRFLKKLSSCTTVDSVREKFANQIKVSGISTGYDVIYLSPTDAEIKEICPQWEIQIHRLQKVLFQLAKADGYNLEILSRDNNSIAIVLPDNLNPGESLFGGLIMGGFDSTMHFVKKLDLLIERFISTSVLISSVESQFTRESILTQYLSNNPAIRDAYIGLRKNKDITKFNQLTENGKDDYMFFCSLLECKTDGMTCFVFGNYLSSIKEFTLSNNYLLKGFELDPSNLLKYVIYQNVGNNLLKIEDQKQAIYYLETAIQEIEMNSEILINEYDRLIDLHTQMAELYLEFAKQDSNYLNIASEHITKAEKYNELYEKEIDALIEDEDDFELPF